MKPEGRIKFVEFYKVSQSAFDVTGNGWSDREWMDELKQVGFDSIEVLDRPSIAYGRTISYIIIASKPSQKPVPAQPHLAGLSSSGQTIRKLVFSQSFIAEKDRGKIKPIAESFIYELERKLGTRLLSFDEIGISDSCYELAFNIMMYGNGGSITINYTQEKNGIEAIEVIGIDAGEGMENPNELLQQSIRAYAKWVEYDIGITEEEPPPHGGYGFRNIVIFPEEVIIETRGIKWIKVGTEEKDLALQRAGSSDIEKGTKITLIWPLYQEEKFREMVRDELRIFL